MPTCRECHGTGKIEVKTELTKRCPDCDGTRLLAAGTECELCNQWGEVGTGEFKVEEKLCTTCWGSGKVTEGSLTTWFLVRVVPTTLLVLGGGGTAMWAAWNYVGITWVTAFVIIIVFGLWGRLMYHFTSQMPGISEISPPNWFLSRAVPTTLTAIAIGGAVVWTAWVYSQNAPATAILALAAFAIWGVLMFYFIIHLPE